MYKLKRIAYRCTAFVAAIGFLGGVGSSILPAVASADALNPLTERSLTLSSSSPGWSYTDGSGNATYAPPNSGANGQKSGHTFQFVTSSTGTIKAFSFQYCTKPAGYCQAPGDNGTTTLSNQAGSGTIATTTGSPTVTGTGTKFTTELQPGDTITTTTPNTYTVASVQSDTSLTLTDNVATADPANSTYTISGPLENADSATTSDLSVHVNSPAEITSSNWTTILGRTGDMAGVPNPDDSEGNFIVLTGSDFNDSDMTVSSDWDMAAVNQEEATTTTGQKNEIIITNTTGVSIPADTHVKVIFFGTDSNYITNPGSGAFFAKINDYSKFTAGTPPTISASDIVDGGVTVANVMNQSIAISTKVLETMDFSVGTVDPDTLTNAELSTATDGNKTAHGQCDMIQNALQPTDPKNVLTMGDPNTQDQNSTKTNYALSTGTTYATHSYFRLSSNSSGGATVYYSGNTLSNTENDQISGIGDTAKAPATGTAQFGLALDNGSSGNYPVSYAIPYTGNAPTYGSTDGTEVSDGTEYGVDNGNILANINANSNPNKDGLSPDWDAASFPSSSAHDPQLSPLQPEPNYGGGTGAINGTLGTTFAFSPTANTIPAAIASESNQVVDCVTGKVRYIGNIAATTPAGVYTTKINYIASPQY